MSLFGPIFYFILVALLFMFWRKTCGLSLDKLLAKSAHDHHQINKVSAGHPRGGTWEEHQQWVKDIESTGD